jgi:hypothetical protein
MSAAQDNARALLQNIFAENNQGIYSNYESNRLIHIARHLRFYNKVLLIRSGTFYVDRNTSERLSISNPHPKAKIIEITREINGTKNVSELSYLFL